MRTVHLENLNSFIVISDVHLRDANSQLSHLFIQEISKINHVDAVIFLGDIFDFIAAPMPFFLEYWKDVFDSFKNLKAKGIQVYFVEGNHDFGFEHSEHARFLECFTECGDFVLKLKHPKYGNIFFTHGDDVVCKASYHPFRIFVKSKWFQKTVAAIFPGSVMHFIFSRYAKMSRKQDNYRTLSFSFMNQKIQDFLHKNQPDCDLFIMGHLHKNIDHLLHTTKSVRILIGEAWFDNPNILKVNGKEICRYYTNYGSQVHIAR